MSTPAQNRALVRHMFEELDKQNIDVVDTALSSLFHDHGAEGVPPGRQGIRMMYARVFKEFPDLITVMHEVLAEGDLVAVYRTCYSTQQGECRGVEATNRRIAIPIMNVFSVEDGQLREHWHAFDLISLRRQLLGDPHEPIV